MINDIFSSNTPPVILAPMAGVGDYPFRQVIRKFGNELLFSEMIASEALVRNNAETDKLATYYNNEKPVVVQIMGANPENMATAAKILADKGYKWIDINMGCPVKKIVSNNSGCALMRDLDLAENIVKTVVKSVNLDVSVKMRLGWDNQNLNVLELAKIAQEEGAKAITIHGRTKSQLYSGVANWDIISLVKRNVKIPVIGNGDINSPEIAKSRLEETNVDGVMIGRAMMGRPWLLSQITEYIKTGLIPAAPSLSEIKATMLYHLSKIIEYYGEQVGSFIARKHICWYALGSSGAKEFRHNINVSNNSATIRKIIEDFTII